MERVYRGITDKPINFEDGDEDLLQVKPYIDGLTDFIKTCATPMTIAIQGGWGTGKTSMMNMIDYELTKEDRNTNMASDVYTIWFNTWQYSQFNMAENLSISMISYFVDKIYKESPEKIKLKSILNSLSKYTNIALQTAILTMGIKPKDLVIPEKEISNFADNLDKIKESYSEAAKKLLKDNNKERLVIFIDDLDRLNPVIAVEVLEVLKIFLDVENCVYVLAVDYDVVTKGIKKKFGDDVDVMKGKSFFDKLIQLPFKVPVQLFQVDKFLRNHLKYYNIDENSIQNNLQNLINGSIGLNPRTMKRLFNSYELIVRIIQYSESNDRINKHESELLFAILCMQMEYEPLYEYFMSTNEWNNFDDENNIFKEETDVFNKISHYGCEDNKNYIYRVKNFLRILGKVISEDDSQSEKLELMSSSLENFDSVLKYSSITTNISSSNSMECTISWDEELTEYNIYKARFKEIESDTSSEIKIKGFTTAVVWILNEIGKVPNYRNKIIEISKYSENYNIPQRFFKSGNMEKIPQSSIKHINSLGIDIVTHYSSRDLRKHLLNLFKAVDIDNNDVSIYGTCKGQTIAGQS